MKIFISTCLHRHVTQLPQHDGSHRRVTAVTFGWTRIVTSQRPDGLQRSGRRGPARVRTPACRQTLYAAATKLATLMYNNALQRRGGPLRFDATRHGTSPRQNLAPPFASNKTHSIAKTGAPNALIPPNAQNGGQTIWRLPSCRQTQRACSCGGRLAISAYRE